MGAVARALMRTSAFEGCVWLEVAEVDVISRNHCNFRRDGATFAATARLAHGARRHTAVRDRCSAGRAMHSGVWWLSAARTGR